MFTMLMIMIVNVGTHIDDKLKMQNAADAAYQTQDHRRASRSQQSRRNIKDNTKKLSTNRQEVARQLIDEEYAHRRTKEAWREALAACGTAPGRKYRRFNAVRLQQASSAEWEARCSLPGPKGGFAATTIDLQEEHAKIKCADHARADPEYVMVPTADHMSQAQALLMRMRQLSIVLKPNKAIIPHSVPNELLRMVLRPFWVYKSQAHWGLGHAKRYRASPTMAASVG